MRFLIIKKQKHPIGEPFLYAKFVNQKKYISLYKNKYLIGKEGKGRKTLFQVMLKFTSNFKIFSDPLYSVIF